VLRKHFYSSKVSPSLVCPLHKVGGHIFIIHLSSRDLSVFCIYIYINYDKVGGWWAARQHDNTSYSSQQHSYYTYILHSPFIFSEEEEKKKAKNSRTRALYRV